MRYGTRLVKIDHGPATDPRHGMGPVPTGRRSVLAGLGLLAMGTPPALAQAPRLKAVTSFTVIQDIARNVGTNIVFHSVKNEGGIPDSAFN